MSESSSDEYEFEGSPPHQANEESDLTAPQDTTLAPVVSSKTASNVEAEAVAPNSKAGAQEKKLPPQKAKGKASKSKATEKTTASKKQKPSAKAKKPAQKTTKKGTTKKASAKGKATTANSKAPAKGKATKADTPESTAMDLFSKHYREFERCTTRLEKLDLFGFFWDEAPEEFVEDYTAKKGSTEDGNAKDDTTKEEESSESDNTESEGAKAPVVYPSHPPVNWEMVRRRRDHGRYVLDIKQQREQSYEQIVQYWRHERKGVTTPNPPVLHAKGVHWDLFKEDILGMCNSAAERRSPEEPDDGKAGSLSHSIKKIIGVLEQIYERTGCRQMNELEVANNREQFTGALDRTTNTEAAFQGKWRQIPFPERQYERLPTKNVVCAGLSELDERIASYELRTSLPDSFVGVSYKYEDDTGKSEAWMKSVLSETGGKKKAQEAAMALAEDEGVIQAQVKTCMEMLLVAVQDKCLTEADVLHQPELRSANWEEGSGKVVRIEEPDQEVSESSPDLVEQPVWGIDCYTRRNVSICLSTEFDQETALVFIEKWLLPAINACPVDLAHDIANAALILEGLPFTCTDKQNTPGDNSITTEERWSHSLIGKSLKNKIQTTGPPWLKLAARTLRRARETMGPDFFRVHPKGHGSIVLRPVIKPNTLVTYYRGEVYPSWRWGEKMDAIDITQARKKLKPALPDFYNMALERPQKDPRKYGMLFVDASRKAGHGSAVSHSCAPTCEVRVAAVKGELCLAMTTLREIEMGEELTFDYNAVTESLVEYRSAVCLCGYGKCRGSFLHFATADCYQRVLDRNAPIAVRFASLAKGCMKEVMSDEDEKTLRNHGFLTAAFGAIAVNRHKTSGLQDNDEMLLDSMDNVPVWLRTYVADVLRYIEYERRALPISLICEDLSKSKVDATCTTLEVKPTEAGSSVGDADESADAGDDPASETGNDKPAKASKPMPIFFFYCRENDTRFRSILKEEEGFEEKDLPGLEFTRAIKRVAGTHWKRLSADEKAKWKQKAEKDWEKQNCQKKALAEKKRKQAPAVDAKKQKAKKSKKKKESLESKFESSNVSFQNADAEGASAMEQRIQQLAQSLSRVGRVLDRHREAVHVAEDGGAEASAETIRSQVHAPITVASDEQIVAWLWNGDGLVPTLLAKIESEECVSPSLKSACRDIRQKYEALDKFGCYWALPEDYRDYPMKPRKARKKVANALMEFRKAILRELKVMARDFKKGKQREKLERKKRLLEDKLAKGAPGTPSTLTDEAVELSSEAKEGNQLQDQPEATPASKETRAVCLEGIETPHQKPTNGSSPELGGSHPPPDDKQKTTTLPEVGSCDSSMATPSLLSEDTKVADNPAIISREVSSEVEEAKECVENSSPSCLAASAGGPDGVDSTACSSHVNANTESLQMVASSSAGSQERANEPAASIEPSEALDAPRSCKQTVSPEDAKTEVSTVLRDLVEAVVARAESVNKSKEVTKEKIGQKDDDDDEKPKPWLKHYAQRYKLQATADLLLLYAKTSTFFLMQPYKPLKSTPIEVYAREIGNAVPRSVIDESIRKTTAKQSPSSRPKDETTPNTKPKDVDTLDEELCKPDEVVAEVTVRYQGDYVLSQLLQWFNAGIGQAPGLPETLGCIRLPAISGCWAQKSGSIPKTKVDRPTVYETKIRPSLVDFFSDPQKRGSPWPGDLKAAFSKKGSADLASDTSRHWIPLGSPVLDLLVTGDDSSILSILDEFGADEAKKRESGLLSTLDEGRPAQAVSNWVQCENPNCLKWRRIPWHVDIDVLAQRFVCSDNKWNKASRSCDAPEDDYEEADNDVVGSFSPGKKPIKAKVKEEGPEVPTAKKALTISVAAEATKPVDETLIVPGARFDVLRKGKSKFSVGEVVEVTTSVDGVKTAKFHFPKLKKDYDEYIEFGSRIAPLYSKVAPPEKRKKGESQKQDSKRPRVDGASAASLKEIKRPRVDSGSAARQEDIKRPRLDNGSAASQMALFASNETGLSSSDPTSTHNIADGGISSHAEVAAKSPQANSAAESSPKPDPAGVSGMVVSPDRLVSSMTIPRKKREQQKDDAARSLVSTLFGTAKTKCVGPSPPKVNVTANEAVSHPSEPHLAESSAPLPAKPPSSGKLQSGPGAAESPVSHPVDAEFVKELKQKMKRREKNKPRKEKRKQEKNKQQHEASSVTISTTGSGDFAVFGHAASAGAALLEGGELEEGELEEGEVKTNVAPGQRLQESMQEQTFASLSQVSNVQQATASTLQAAAAEIGPEALGALSSLMSMRIPRNHQPDRFDQPNRHISTSSMQGERSDLVGGRHVARAPNTSNNSAFPTQQHVHQNARSFPQRPPEPNPTRDEMTQQSVTQVYSAMARENQKELQRMQMQNAMNAQIQRQRLQQVQSAMMHAEIQRQRSGASFFQAPPRSIPDHTSRQSRPHDNYSDYAADFRFGGGYRYRDYRHDYSRR